MVVGLAIALWRPGRLAMPEPAFVAAQSIVGVAIGSYLQASSLSAVAGDWLPVTLVSAATLALSLLAGAVLSRTTASTARAPRWGWSPAARRDRHDGRATSAATTGSWRSCSTCASWSSSLLTPLLPRCLPGPSRGRRGRPAPPAVGDLEDWLLRSSSSPVGALAARAVRLPAAALLGPMILSGALTLRCRRGLRRPARAARAGLRADRPAGRAALHARTLRAARAAARARAIGAGRAARRCFGLARRAPLTTPRSRCSTPTWRRPRAVSTRCSRWRSAPARTRRSSSPCRGCASW